MGRLALLFFPSRFFGPVLAATCGAGLVPALRGFVIYFISINLGEVFLVLLLGV